MFMMTEMNLTTPAEMKINKNRLATCAHYFAHA